MKTNLKLAFGPSFLIFAALALVLGILAWHQLGWEETLAALVSDGEMVLHLVSIVGAALLIAGFITVLLPRDAFARLMGEGSGLRGMTVATLAGALTPGGPMTSFPLVLALRKGGSGVGPLVAYITSWSTLGLQRLLMWEIPLMGLPFVLVRFIASLPLAIVAGLIARLLPLRLEEEPEEGADPSRPASER